MLCTFPSSSSTASHLLQSKTLPIKTHRHHIVILGFPCLCMKLQSVRDVKILTLNQKNARTQVNIRYDRFTILVALTCLRQQDACGNRMAKYFLFTSGRASSTTFHFKTTLQELWSLMREYNKRASMQAKKFQQNAVVLIKEGH